MSSSSSLQTGKISYVTCGKDSWVLEIPKEAATRYPPPAKGWIEKKGTQKVVRYWTDYIAQRQRPLAEAQEDLALAENHILRKLLLRFDDNRTTWQRVIEKLSELDCLLCLARVSLADGMSRPEIVDSPSSPLLEIRGGKHPCLANRLGSRFVPNDVTLSEEQGSAILLTGPNMGGKSTVLRQVCLSVILAQLGCYVMADSMRMSPVDRVFTRIGASDDIFAGQSTFLVELLETASVCNFATRNSLVILDELGRGTSTHDGYAIAFGVLDRLVKHSRCRTLFSTHYHNLADEWKRGGDSSLQVCHMAALVNGVSTSDLIDHDADAVDDRMDVDTDGNERQDVTFLYQIRPGACPKSYGLNVAQLAHLPAGVIREASIKSIALLQDLKRSRAHVPYDGALPVGFFTDQFVLSEPKPPKISRSYSL